MASHTNVKERGHCVKQKQKSRINVEKKRERVPRTNIEKGEGKTCTNIEERKGCLAPTLKRRGNLASMLKRKGKKSHTDVEEKGEDISYRR